MTKRKTVKHLVDGQPVELVQSIATSLEKLTRSAAELLQSGLTMRALVLLLHDTSKVGRRDIEKVLAALPELDLYFLETEED